MTSLRIRPLETDAERRACVALQDETWGEGFSDRVPASILLVAGEMGGVVSGAFEGDRLVGFVFGITGLRRGRLEHWSDMLAVRAEQRGRGVGLALKRHQREQLLGMGVSHACWTFDPLVARNAHLNLNRLGATVAEYRRDLYGHSDSPLHAGIVTDRLLAEWALDSERVHRHLAAPSAIAAPAPEQLLNPSSSGARHPRPASAAAAPDAATVGIAVPADIQRLKTEEPELARAWRQNVREAFEACIGAGYAAIGVRRAEEVAVYVLTRAFAR